MHFWPIQPLVLKRCFMGAKKINQHVLLDAVATSGTAVVTSASQNINNLDNLFLQIRFTGTSTGTLVVQASADNVLWDDFVFSPALTQPAGSSIGYGVSLNQIPAGWFRVQYTNASGAGVLTVNYFIKDVN